MPIIVGNPLLKRSFWVKPQERIVFEILRRVDISIQNIQWPHKCHLLLYTMLNVSLIPKTDTELHGISYL